MATPQSTTSQDDGSGAKKLEQITFRFCSECSNMLYPKEDKDAHSLQFTCRTCQYTEEASSSCVFRNVLNNSAGETAGVTQDVGSDPTVSDVLPVFCLTCGTVILCGQCNDSPAYMSVVKRQDKRDEDSGFDNYVLTAGIVPFTEYDEYFEGDDHNEAAAAAPDVSHAVNGNATVVSDLVPVSSGEKPDGTPAVNDTGLAPCVDRVMRNAMVLRGNGTPATHN
ncbi:hypothetical protein XA68_13230 [Ophiocordyceps unilateralis]|uniref:DNA-directed RNA polymerase II subunit RPB9-like zinc ribbon domain-containing protein n=1 Tax=Ophiocordyceps unilateralis TaxID=268505 RepID=A0A2A9PBV5_OPHUN|nr:hypothetical protein XA68_13230 [Ophiocordyceps unilateralis]